MLHSIDNKDLKSNFDLSYFSIISFDMIKNVIIDHIKTN